MPHASGGAGGEAESFPKSKLLQSNGEEQIERVGIIYVREEIASEVKWLDLGQTRDQLGDALDLIVIDAHAGINWCKQAQAHPTTGAPGQCRRSYRRRRRWPNVRP